MKMRMLAASLLLIGAPVISAAQEVPPTVPKQAETARLGVDTPIETVLADPAGEKVLASHNLFPQQHPAYENFKMLTLRDVQPMSEGAITVEMLVKLATELGAIK